MLSGSVNKQFTKEKILSRLFVRTLKGRKIGKKERKAVRDAEISKGKCFV